LEKYANRNGLNVKSQAARFHQG